MTKRIHLTKWTPSFPFLAAKGLKSSHFITMFSLQRNQNINKRAHCIVVDRESLNYVTIWSVSCFVDHEAVVNNLKIMAADWKSLDSSPRRRSALELQKKTEDVSHSLEASIPVKRVENASALRLIFWSIKTTHWRKAVCLQIVWQVFFPKSKHEITSSGSALRREAI